VEGEAGGHCRDGVLEKHACKPQDGPGGGGSLLKRQGRRAGGGRSIKLGERGKIAVQNKGKGPSVFWGKTQKLNSGERSTSSHVAEGD